MDLFPFISRCSHEAIVASKDEALAHFNLTISYLKELIDRGAIERDLFNARLAEALTPKVAAVPAKRQREPEKPLEEPRTLDLAMVDPDDAEALMLIVKREIPPGVRTNASAVMRSMERLKKQVVAAHEARTLHIATPSLIPTSITDRIAQAERDGALEAQQAGA